MVFVVSLTDRTSDEYLAVTTAASAFTSRFSPSNSVGLALISTSAESTASCALAAMTEAFPDEDANHARVVFAWNVAVVPTAPETFSVTGVAAVAFS